MIQITFWGVRGSIPCPGPHTMKYGGNTACLEIFFPEVNRRIIIDAGSGIRELANKLVTEQLPKGPITTEIYLTHTHWDHIMGFPFFIPAYIPGTKIKVFGPVTYEDEPLDEVVGGQMKYRYFPVNMGELAATIEYARLKETPLIDLGDGITLATKILNHPITALGYRFSFQGSVFCTAYDTEQFRNLFITDPTHPSYDEAMAMEGDMAAKEQNQAMADFFSGADLLVHDAQYTKEEYEKGKVGWGHSAIEDAIATGKAAKVKKLALFHHDPDRSDPLMDELAALYSTQGGATSPEIFFAREGMTVAI
ncbi:MAG: MBL fold metallo-hydrolase [Desulfobulbaceae bacterium]|nr:MBL fold metallo-hydrolase [Desulfobulbaceae bacterium]